MNFSAKIWAKFDRLVKAVNLGGFMKKYAVIFMVLAQILFASNLLEPDFEIFYDKNATSKQTDAGLDQIMEFLSQTRSA